MQDLTVIGVESGALLAADAEGERYRIVIDDVLRSRIRQSTREPDDGPRVPPRDIQAHIRAGLSAQEVAEMTGASLEYVRRFEGPIVAEREHVVTAALAVPVRQAHDIDPLEPTDTFGSVIRQRLASLSATGERWAAWKEGDGWVVKLTFAADGIDHDARWSFDLRKQTLAPLGSEATALSQKDEFPDGLIPRLHAVTDSAPDESRFDSGAFAPVETDGEAEASAPVKPLTVRGSASVDAALRRDEPQDHGETADLLDALRRRRGEREAASYREEDPAPTPTDVTLDTFDDEPAGGAQAAPTSGKNGKRGRAEMPSWDEIVFGARTDDDLA